MKILTGALRGREIQFKPNPHLRPTADKVRKAIFDMLQGAVEGKRVLDLFSGTGALGFEALSNGAKEAVFVEKDPIQVQKIEHCLQVLGLQDRAEVVCADVMQAFAGKLRAEKAFDLILMDPPYQKGLAEETLGNLRDSSLISNDSIIVGECRRDESPEKAMADFFAILGTRYYGDTKVFFLRKK